MKRTSNIQHRTLNIERRKLSQSRLPAFDVQGSMLDVQCSMFPNLAMDDLKFAFRQLLKQPGFTAVAVLTLALGIGANTAIFSVINGLLLNPLPYPEPDQLVTLCERSPQRGIEQERVSGPNYLDWRAQNTALSDMSVSPGW